VILAHHKIAPTIIRAVPVKMVNLCSDRHRMPHRPFSDENVLQLPDTARIVLPVAERSDTTFSVIGDQNCVHIPVSPQAKVVHLAQTRFLGIYRGGAV